MNKYSIKRFSVFGKPTILRVAEENTDPNSLGNKIERKVGNTLLGRGQSSFEEKYGRPMPKTPFGILG